MRNTTPISGRLGIILRAVMKKLLGQLQRSTVISTGFSASPRTKTRSAAYLQKTARAIDVDHTLIVYVTGALVSLYGLILFIAYWIKAGRASFVYACVTLLLFGLLMQYSMAFFSRQAVLVGDTYLLRSFWWPFRNYGTILAVALLSGGLSLRWWRSRNGKKNIIATKNYKGPDRRRRQL